MKAESMQLFTIPITQNYQGVPFAPNHGDASQMYKYGSLIRNLFKSIIRKPYLITTAITMEI